MQTCFILPRFKEKIAATDLAEKQLMNVFGKKTCIFAMVNCLINVFIKMNNIVKIKLLYLCPQLLIDSFSQSSLSGLSSCFYAFLQLIYEEFPSSLGRDFRDH